MLDHVAILASPPPNTLPGGRPLPHQRAAQPPQCGVPAAAPSCRLQPVHRLLTLASYCLPEGCEMSRDTALGCAYLPASLACFFIFHREACARRRRRAGGGRAGGAHAHRQGGQNTKQSSGTAPRTDIKAVSAGPATCQISTKPHPPPSFSNCPGGSRAHVHTQPSASCTDPTRLAAPAL